MAEQPGARLIKLYFDFITKTPIGKLKVAELVFTLLAGACASSVESYYHCKCSAKLGFLSFVSWTAFINILIDMIIHVIGLWERLHWIFRHPALFCVLCILAVLGFIIGSALTATCAIEWCVVNPTTTGVAAFFGFVCLGLFAGETYLQFTIYRGMNDEARQQTSGQSKAPDYIEPPMAPPPPYSSSGGVV